MAAAGVGTAVLAGAGLRGASLLALFFISGSLLTRFSPTLDPAARDRAVGTRRNAYQVIANGTWAAVGGLLLWIPSLLVGVNGWPLLTGSLAAAQGDTWATETGAFSAKPPRLFTTGKAVAPGTSGGTTLLGTIGGLTGVATMAGLAILVAVPDRAVAGCVLGGVSGVLIDSLLGATVQASYYCSSCEESCETALHRCGLESEQVRGWSRFNNDAVNFVATGVGGLISVGYWLLR